MKKQPIVGRWKRLIFPSLRVALALFFQVFHPPALSWIHFFSYIMQSWMIVNKDVEISPEGTIWLGSWRVRKLTGWRAGPGGTARSSSGKGNHLSMTGKRKTRALCSWKTPLSSMSPAPTTEPGTQRCSMNVCGMSGWWNDRNRAR